MQSSWIELALFPFAVILQVTPIVAIAPLLLIYAPDTQTALLICAFLVAFFPILSNMVQGLKSVDHNLLNLFDLYGATRWQTLIYLKIPASMPYFMAGLRIGGGLALIAAVVAEFAAGSAGAGSGLAFRLLEAQLPAQHAAAVRGADPADGHRRRHFRRHLVHLLAGAAPLARKRRAAGELMMDRPLSQLHRCTIPAMMGTARWRRRAGRHRYRRRHVSPSIAPHGSRGPGRDLDGGLVLPALRRYPHPSRQGPYLAAQGRTRTAPGWARCSPCRTTARALWSPSDVERRMEFSLRAAYAHGTAAIRTHLDSAPPQHEISWDLFERGARALGRPHRTAGGRR